jgi:hypothetical protein
MAGTPPVVARRCRQTRKRLPGSGGGQGQPDRRRSRAPWPRENRHRLVAGRAVGPREQGWIGPGIWQLPPARPRPASTGEPPGDRTTRSADLPWSERRRDCITCHHPCQAIPALNMRLAEGKRSHGKKGDFWDAEAVGGDAISWFGCGWCKSGRLCKDYAVWRSASGTRLEPTLAAPRDVDGPAKLRILPGVTVLSTGAWFGAVTGAWSRRWGGEPWVPPC